MPKKRTKAPHERFEDAIRVVVRYLGGSRQFLLASGYVPSESLGYKAGFWVSPNNRNIMWRTRHAIADHFTRFRWHDRAKAAEASLKPESNVTLSELRKHYE